MKPEPDSQTLWLECGALALLALISVGGAMLSHAARSQRELATARNFKGRLCAWWVMAAVYSLTMVSGRIGALAVFALISFLALREFVVLAPTRHGDYRALFWSFAIILPLQYVLIGLKWYGLSTVLIPVYAFLFLPLWSALSGDAEHFFARMAKLQWGLMLCVYGVSFLPALLGLDMVRFRGQDSCLLIFLAVVVESSDVLQNLWSRMRGGHVIAPALAPSKTLEGMIGGVLSATLLGTAMWWALPFTLLQSAGLSFAIALVGFAASFVASAIRRGCGIGDLGPILGRVYPLCFAAPLFFQLLRPM